MSISAGLLLVSSFMNLLLSTASWSCLLQKDASFHDCQLNASEPCDRKRTQRARAPKREAAMLSHGAGERHESAPRAAKAPAQAPSPSPAVKAPGGAPAAGVHATPPPKQKAFVDHAAVLRSELHIPTTIREIHDSPQGPLSHFLQVVHTEFCRALDVSPKRLSIIGIRGEYTQLESMLQDELVVQASSTARSTTLQSYSSLNLTDSLGFVDLNSNASSSPTPGDPAKEAKNHEVVVDLEILPAEKASDKDPQTLFKALQGQIGSKQSTLMSSPIAAQLKGSTLNLGAKHNKSTDDETDHKGSTTHWMPSSLLLMALFTVLGA